MLSQVFVIFYYAVRCAIFFRNFISFKGIFHFLK